jgi:ubiquinone/menaquinone biosynthesis C-methylase UbiE
MSQQERWQLGCNAPEVYERHMVPAIFGPWAPLLVAQAALHTGERVLDVACGTGVLTRLAATQVGITGNVVGLDLNPGMLAVARTLPLPQGAAIDWREGDAGALPFVAATFDVVFCQLGLQYFPDRRQAVREMYRVLSPNGRLVALVWRSIVIAQASRPSRRRLIGTSVRRQVRLCGRPLCLAIVPKSCVGY